MERNIPTVTPLLPPPPADTLTKATVVRWPSVRPSLPLIIIWVFALRLCTRTDDVPLTSLAKSCWSSVELEALLWRPLWLLDATISIPVSPKVTSINVSFCCPEWNSCLFSLSSLSATLRILPHSHVTVSSFVGEKHFSAPQLLFYPLVDPETLHVSHSEGDWSDSETGYDVDELHSDDPKRTSLLFSCLGKIRVSDVRLWVQ